MEQLPRLKARISSLTELRDLFRALRALSASHVQEAQGALEGIRRYVSVVCDALAEGASLLPLVDEQGAPAELSPVRVLMVVGSEHGFSGSLNERLLDRAKTEIDEACGLVVIGRRTAVLAHEMELPVDHSFAMATHTGGVIGAARRVFGDFVGLSTADVIFGEYRKGGYYEIKFERIIPIDPAIFGHARLRSPPIHHLMPAALLQQLTNEYLFAELTRILMEALASENGARLHVMENADHNIGEKLEDLTRTERALRQEEITSELLDVVTGAEAILGARP